MRVFITGISGFLGRHLARTLEAEGHKVIGVDINPKTIVHTWLSDMETFDLLQDKR